MSYQPQAINSERLFDTVHLKAKAYSSLFTNYVVIICVFEIKSDHWAGKRKRFALNIKQ